MDSEFPPLFYKYILVSSYSIRLIPSDFNPPMQYNLESIGLATA